jgi:hypothetical protein
VRQKVAGWFFSNIIQPAAAGALALLYFGGIVQGQMVKWSDSSLTHTRMQPRQLPFLFPAPKISLRYCVIFFIFRPRAPIIAPEYINAQL